MTIMEKIQNPCFVNKLNEMVIRYTNFESWDDLISVKHNYKPEMRIKNNLPNITKREILELADYYDEYMRHNNDPRCIYRHL